MKRPGSEPTRKRILNNSRMRDMELGERSSRSLLANVLDLDDDFRGISHQPNSHHGNSMHNSSTFSGYKGDPPPRDNHCSRPNPMAPNHHTSRTGEYSGYHQPCSELRDILKELQFLTQKVKKEDQFVDDCNDWKFAAMVIDRLCLWLFTIFTIASTCAILFSAPHLFS